MVTGSTGSPVAGFPGHWVAGSQNVTQFHVCLSCWLHSWKRKASVWCLFVCLSVHGYNAAAAVTRRVVTAGNTQPAASVRSGQLSEGRCICFCWFGVMCTVQFNLVCGWSFLVQFASTALMGGLLISSFLAGALADRYAIFAQSASA